MAQCVACGREYDPAEFGAGDKYCTKLCKHTKGGTVPLTAEEHRSGRKRRFRKVPPSMVRSIIQDLSSTSFQVRQVIKDGVAVPNRYILSYASDPGTPVNYFHARLCLAGYTRDELWTDIVVTISPYKNFPYRLEFVSACRRAKVGTWPSGKTRWGACHQPAECNKCDKLHVFRALWRSNFIHCSRPDLYMPVDEPDTPAP